MSQTKYLFLGGPLDQQWMNIGPEAPSPVVSAVESTNPRNPVTARMVNYYRKRVVAPGWLTPITVYNLDPVLPPERGTAMPGWIVDVRRTICPSGAWRWIDSDEAYPGEATRNTIMARGCRP